MTYRGMIMVDDDEIEVDVDFVAPHDDDDFIIDSITDVYGNLHYITPEEETKLKSTIFMFLINAYQERDL